MGGGGELWKNSIGSQYLFDSVRFCFVIRKVFSSMLRPGTFDGFSCVPAFHFSAGHIVPSNETTAAQLKSSDELEVLTALVVCNFSRSQQSVCGATVIWLSMYDVRCFSTMHCSATMTLCWMQLKFDHRKGDGSWRIFQSYIVSATVGSHHASEMTQTRLAVVSSITLANSSFHKLSKGRP